MNKKTSHSYQKKESRTNLYKGKSIVPNDVHNDLKQEHAKRTNDLPNRVSYKKTGINKNTQSNKTTDLPIPTYMVPKIYISASDRYTFYEEGGISNFTPDAKALYGIAKVICNTRGEPKKPIYIFKKRSFTSATVSQKSLFFTIQPHDYIISESHRSPTDLKTGYVRIIIYKIHKGHKFSQLTEKKDNNLTCARTIQPKIIANINIKLNKFSIKNGYENYINKPIDIDNEFIKYNLISILHKRNMLFLKNAVLSAIKKAGYDETSYSYCKSTLLVNRFSNLKSL